MSVWKDTAAELVIVSVSSVFILLLCAMLFNIEKKTIRITTPFKFYMFTVRLYLK